MNSVTEYTVSYAVKPFLSAENENFGKTLTIFFYQRTVPSLRGEEQGDLDSLTDACASPFRYTKNAFLERHITTRQQKTMQKRNDNVQTYCSFDVF